MSSLNVFAFIYVCFIILSSVFSNVLVQESNVVHFSDVSGSADKSAERHTIDENYINIFEGTKESWVDPYDLISLPEKENQEESMKPIVQSSEITPCPFALDNDDQPLFSDFIGDVGDKVFNTDETIANNDLESRGYFAKGRQQICVLDSIYISRWLKKLILKVEKESDLEPSVVSFHLDSIALDNLKEMSTAKSLEIAQLDDLICSLISQAVITRKEAYDWTILYAYCTDILWVIVYVASFGFITYVLNRSFMRHPKTTLLFCGIALSVFCHWMYLHQQKKSYKHSELPSMMNIPDQCQKNDFGFLELIQEYIKSYFTSNECAKYYEVLLADLFWEMNFVVTVSEAVTTFLSQPPSTSSQTGNSAIKQLFDGFSIYMIIFLVLFISLLIILCTYVIRFLSPTVGSHASTTLSKNKVSKTASNMQGTRVKTILKHDHAVSDNLKGSAGKSVPFFSNDIDTRRENILENCCGSGSRYRSYQTFGQSLSDDNSDSYSDDSSCSGNSTDSQDCCLCCVTNNELLQELHTGCRVCENSSNTSANATNSTELEHLFKRSDRTDSVNEQNFHDTHFIDQMISTSKRTYEPTAKQNLLNGINEPTNIDKSDDISPRNRIDPLAG